MVSKVRIREIANWVNLSTPLGLAIAAAGGARLHSAPGGLWLAEGYRPRFPVAGAFTVGNVITTAQTFAEREQIIPGTLRHEEGHTWQYVYCLGPLGFFPAYGVAMAWSWLTTGDRAANCYFEKEAGLEIGGYPLLPKRPAVEGLRSLAAILRSRLGSATRA